ncbi:MAG: mandelate racemase/muconate lactonizing enzyme family protein [Arenicellales bacterium]|jgi:muconate cycloisomerase|nr:mandelate racemase/muconate lactonizing enzyme family protein [Arenicellales bacterium]MDP6769030.1 mandelate racemase/muconate lactonizing enzyme family protein [Arenicellales bacterium]|tara:strand:+ start:4713 stop:5837 length:1125 start_codon:yes stop_codon:yes gene_type:complete
MKITEIRTTPLRVPYKTPYHWSQGVVDSAVVILVEVHTDANITGYGESIGTASSSAIQDHLRLAAKWCIGRNPFENAKLMRDAYHALFQAFGTCSSPRYAGQVFAGLEMALWDVMGKAADRPVHELLGGAIQHEIAYFGFPQGETAEQIALHAGQLAKDGCDVIYVKVGRGDLLDLAIVEQTRAAIGPERRLRLDPNEKWGPLKSVRMIRKLSEFDIEFVEQPTNCESLSALAQIHASSPVAIAADQLAFTPYDVFNICRERAADLIVLGLHETGGITRFRQGAHIAEAAGINICIHGLYETGITTCASNQAAATISNLDDGNQYMNHLLEWDIIKLPDLTLKKGRLTPLKGPGLGFELDFDAVQKAKKYFLDS